MMRAWGCVALAATASALMSCSLLKKPGAVDGGEDGPSGSASAAVEAGPIGEAVNQSEMTRYPDEKPIDHAPLTTESGGMMRTQAGAGGDLVVVLKKGTEVQKIAEHESYYLVLADDPKDATHKLMGWIAESAFSGGGSLHRTEPEPRGDGGAAPSCRRRGHEAGARSRQAARRSQGQRRVPARVRGLRGGVPHDLQDRRRLRRSDGPLLGRLLHGPRGGPVQVS